jgi:23S rRNA maturation-related 3'-5' exoribonuclease YhaM
MRRKVKDSLLLILFAINKVKDPKTKLECTKFLDYLKKYPDSQAAQVHHSNYPGGLLAHIVEMIILLEDITEGLVKKLDKDKMLWLILCHDFNKVGWTKDSKVEDVPIRGDDQFETSILRAESVIGRKLTETEMNGIRSHHGPWGTEKPVSLEAKILHPIDMISSHLREHTEEV